MASTPEPKLSDYKIPKKTTTATSTVSSQDGGEQSTKPVQEDSSSEQQGQKFPNMDNNIWNPFMLSMMAMSDFMSNMQEMSQAQSVGEQNKSPQLPSDTSGDNVDDSVLDESVTEQQSPDDGGNSETDAELLLLQAAGPEVSQTGPPVQD